MHKTRITFCMLNIWFILLSSPQFTLAKETLTTKIISESGENRVQMIELYSSESCSSCPPADIWLSALQSKTGLWKKFIPIAFHVDYWNHLNWKDEFSSKEMTQRQTDISKKWPEPSVYTPAVVLNGAELKMWRTNELTFSSEKSAYQLKLTQNHIFEYDVDLKGLKSKTSYISRTALLGFGLESNVTSGENSGVKLKHNFVVLDWASLPVESNQKIHFAFKKPQKKYARLAVVTWIEEVGNPTPLQATGGYL